MLQWHFYPLFRVLINYFLYNPDWCLSPVEQGMPDPDAPKAKEAKKEEDIGDMWEKYWNMDPENFIWGIDPNEAPPEVSLLA